MGESDSSALVALAAADRIRVGPEPRAGPVEHVEALEAEAHRLPRRQIRVGGGLGGDLVRRHADAGGPNRPGMAPGTPASPSGFAPVRSSGRTPTGTSASR